MIQLVDFQVPSGSWLPWIVTFPSSLQPALSAGGSEGWRKYREKKVVPVKRRGEAAAGSLRTEKPEPGDSVQGSCQATSSDAAAKQ